MRPPKIGRGIGTIAKLPRGSGARVLSAVPLFAGLHQRDVRRVASVAEETWFNAGHVVVQEGEPGSSFYVILDGEARVTKGASGRTVARLKAGDYFGELALLDGGPRSATVIAETSLDAVGIQRSAFRKMLTQEPEVGLRIMAGVAARLREYERQLIG